MNILPFDHLFKPAPVKTIKDINPGEVFVWDNESERTTPILKLYGTWYMYFYDLSTFDAITTLRLDYPILRLRHSLHIEGIEP